MRRLSVFRLLVITSFSFSITALFNTLEPAVLGHKILRLAPDQPNTAMGLTTFAGLVVAIFVQPIVGVLSDATRSRWGRRRPYFFLGTAFLLISLYLISMAPTFALLVLGMVLTQIASNTVQAPWQALIPDLVPKAQRGQASGLKAVLDILGFVAGRAIAAQFLGRYPQWGASAVLAAVGFPAFLFLTALVLITFAAPRDNRALPERVRPDLRRALADAFRVDLKRYPTFGWWFVNRFLFWSAFILLNTFLLFYLIDVIGLSEAEAQSYLGQISLVLGTALALVTLPSGWLADRIGRRPLVIVAGIVACLGVVVLLVTRQLPILTLGGMIVGLAIGTFLSANWALVTDIVPPSEAARYLGIANIAAASGSALSRFLGGALIDSLNDLLHSGTTGYVVMYSIAATMFLLSAVVALRLPHDKQQTLPDSTP